MEHICRWPGCMRRRPRHLLMCAEHWRQLPKDLRHAFWSSHRPQFPADAYLRAVGKALAYARRQQGQEQVKTP